MPFKLNLDDNKISLILQYAKQDTKNTINKLFVVATTRVSPVSQLFFPFATAYFKKRKRIMIIVVDKQ